MGRVKQYFEQISADPEEKDPEEKEQSGPDLPEWIPGGMLAQIPESTLYEEYLEQCCLPGARPYGCRKYFEIKTKTKYIGTLQRGKWLTDLYEDTEGDYWHSKRVRVGRWIITAFECFRGRRDLDSPP